jgi:hypothetical protein
MQIISLTFRVMVKPPLQGKPAMVKLIDKKVNNLPEEKLPLIQIKLSKWGYLVKEGKWMTIYRILKILCRSVPPDLRVNRVGGLKGRKNQLIGSQIAGEMGKTLP